MKEKPFEIPKRKLEYADEFKDVVHNHPGIIDFFKRIREKSKQEIPNGGFWEENGVVIAPVNRSGETLLDKAGSDFFKVKVDENEYFMKCKRGYLNNEEVESGGVDEANSLKLAREMIKGMDNVDVVDFQLGYQDEKTNTTYFVSRWISGVKLSHYLGKEETEIAPNEIETRKKTEEELWNRAYAIYDALGDNFWDAGPNNMMYDPTSGKITIFDIHKKDQ